MATQRAPKGYRIEKWADGTFHVYFKETGECILEARAGAAAVWAAQEHAHIKNMLKNVRQRGIK